MKVTRGFNNGAPITTRQLEYIEAIEEELGVKFEGKTKQEASEFIAKYDESMQFRELYNRHPLAFKDFHY